MFRSKRWLGSALFAAITLAPACAQALELRSLGSEQTGSYHVVAIDLAQETLELHWRDANDTPLQSIERLREWGAAQGRLLEFAANAGIYDRGFRPLGLYIENGEVLRPLNAATGANRAGNFAMQPNGVFYVGTDGRAGVLTTSAWQAHAPAARLATQSGPMLVIDGEINTKFDAASTSLKWRSGVCAPSPRNVVFAVSDQPVSFHAFARVFRDELGCRNALYLDGTLSRIYTREQGYAGAPAMMVKPYAGMFAVFAAPVGAR